MARPIDVFDSISPESVFPLCITFDKLLNKARSRDEQSVYSQDRVPNMSKLVTISGCSGGGKSTLLEELARRGYPVVKEPGRRIVLEEEQNDGIALPWISPEAFAKRAIEVSIADMKLWPEPKSWVFFDRGLIDACSALASTTGQSTKNYLENQPRYHNVVFLTPPWREIYVTDEQRKHPFSEARKEYDRLLQAFPQAGYEVSVLDKTSVSQRADFVLAQLEVSAPSNV